VQNKYSGEARTKLALEISRKIQMANSCWAHSIFAGWIAEIPFNDNIYTASMKDCCNEMSVGSFQKYRNQLAAGASLLGKLNEKVSLSLSYEINVGEDKYISQNAKANMQWNF
jgi:outer membrane autotransporter protein